jgi:phosphoribosyl-ATP pyrophosphohydrolase
MIIGSAKRGLAVPYTLESLAQVIAERARATGDQSYTRQLLDGGPEKCARKLGEEAVETALAGVSGDKAALVAESADLLYHLLVLLAARDVALHEVYAELERRTARSGLEEKESRGR